MLLLLVKAEEVGVWKVEQDESMRLRDFGGLTGRRGSAVGDEVSLDDSILSLQVGGSCSSPTMLQGETCDILPTSPHSRFCLELLKWWCVRNCRSS